MAFPFTHLIVAFRVLAMQPTQSPQPMSENDAAMFLLGSLAPDAVHYRGEFHGAEMKNIGAAKKITHLCPVSNERWGRVTDNDGWIKCVEEFLRKNAQNVRGLQNPFAAGYAAHVLTDIHNNRTLWDNFRRSFPDEAAKGYASDYYTDLKNIDTRLYLETAETQEIFALLAKADARETKNAWGNAEALVSSEEIHAIQHNILHEHFKSVPKPPSGTSPETLPGTLSPPSIKTPVYHFVTFDDMPAYIQSAAEFVVELLTTL